MTAYEMRISDWSADVCSSDLFQGIQVLLKVVELGSLSGAARALDMSPTMATKHVAAIEQRLGVRLLHRTTRKVTPTEIGRTFVQNAERIIARSEEHTSELQSLMRNSYAVFCLKKKQNINIHTTR